MILTHNNIYYQMTSVIRQELLLVSKCNYGLLMWYCLCKSSINILSVSLIFFYSKSTSHCKLGFAFDVIFLGNPFSQNKSAIVYIYIYIYIYIVKKFKSNLHWSSAIISQWNANIRIIIGEIFPTPTPKKILGKIQKSACASTFQSFQ